MRDAVFNGFSTGWVTAWLSVAAATPLSMDELEFIRGWVYGADHEDAGPRHHALVG
ncbi:hypothetical protein BX257_9130 [Streptomyces sp. 3212.3]|nr:hypothetical protein BX257_9130 [Streptomyces sp. 3212.3]